jgi:hypothetical protein
LLRATFYLQTKGELRPGPFLDRQEVKVVSGSQLDPEPDAGGCLLE